MEINLQLSKDEKQTKALVRFSTEKMASKAVQMFNRRFGDKGFPFDKKHTLICSLKKDVFES